MIGLILPAFYLGASSLTARKLATQLREYQYSEVISEKGSAANVQALFASLAQTVNPNDLTRLRDKLKDVAHFPINKDDPLGDYLRTLSNFSDNMLAIEQGLHAVRSFIASGNQSQALADLEQMASLADQTKVLLKSLYVLLDRVAAQYEIDTTTQLQKIEELDAHFQTYSAQIDQLGSELTAQQGGIQTILVFNASKRGPLVSEVFSVFGILRDKNGTTLDGRSITISWGLNQTVVRLTDFEGKFDASISFPPRFPAGLTNIEAAFEPEHSDVGVYLPSRSLLQVQVDYPLSIITAVIYPANAKPLDFVYVTGNLSSAGGKPLDNRTIAMQLDNSILGNVTTNSIGVFWFRFAVPRTTSNGTHTVTATFNGTGDLFAPSNITLPFFVELIGSQIQVRLDRTALFSGMKVLVYGTVSYSNTTLADNSTSKSGNVTVYVDSIQYGNATVNDDGSFSSSIQLPLGLNFGSHVIRFEYTPDRPWIQSSNAAEQVYVYNTPLVVIAGVLASAGIITSLFVGLYVVRKRRTIVLAPPEITEPTFARKPILTEEFSRESLISNMEAESDHAAKVRRAYRLTQALIGQKLGEEPRESETDWEYFSRVAKSAPNITDMLRRLVELFELAEYSPYPIEEVQGKEAAGILLELREQIEA
jgi:hypothetical protein